MRTYGEKPIVFKFDHDETEYMIGSGTYQLVIYIFQNCSLNFLVHEEDEIAQKIRENVVVDFFSFFAEVGNYLRLFRGALYKRYPGLTRRTLSNEERKKLVEMGHSQHVTASLIR